MHANVSDDYHALAKPLVSQLSELVRMERVSYVWQPRTNNSLKFDQSLPLARKAAVRVPALQII